MKAIYWDQWWYNQRNVSLNNKEFIYFENKLIGVPQIRQLRISSNSCSIPPSFRSIFSNCFGDITTQNANQSAYGLQTQTAYDDHWIGFLNTILNTIVSDGSIQPQISPIVIHTVEVLLLTMMGGSYSSSLETVRILLNLLRTCKTIGGLTMEQGWFL